MYGAGFALIVNTDGCEGEFYPKKEAAHEQALPAMCGFCPVKTRHGVRLKQTLINSLRLLPCLCGRNPV